MRRQYLEHPLRLGRVLELLLVLFDDVRLLLRLLTRVSVLVELVLQAVCLLGPGLKVLDLLKREICSSAFAGAVPREGVPATHLA